MSDTAHVHELVHEHFSAGLPAEQHALMRAHVRECEACERVYERYATAEAAFAPAGPSGLSVAAKDRLEHALLGVEPRRRRSVLPSVSVGLVVATAALGVLLTLNRGPAPTPPTIAPPELAPRGGADRIAPVGLSLRVLRLRTEAGRVVVDDLATKDSTVRPGDRLALLYANYTGAQTAQVDLRVDERAPLSLVPRRAIATDVEDARLGDPIEVEASWPTGSLRIEARFEGPDGEVVRVVQIERAGP